MPIDGNRTISDILKATLPTSEERLPPETVRTFFEKPLVARSDCVRRIRHAA